MFKQVVNAQRKQQKLLLLLVLVSVFLSVYGFDQHQWVDSVCFLPVMFGVKLIFRALALCQMSLSISLFDSPYGLAGSVFDYLCQPRQQ